MQDHVYKAIEDSGVSLNTDLGRLSNHMSRFLMCSRSDGTTKSYMHSFNRLRKFILQHGHSDIPAQPVHIALYITHLLDNGTSYSSVNFAIYSIKWMHEIKGHMYPTGNSSVKSLQESLKRLTGKPVKRNDPVDSETLQTLCETYKDSADLLVLRNLTMIFLDMMSLVL